MNGALGSRESGLPSSPPYLSLVNEPKKNNVSFLNGVSFASEAARILDGTDPYLVSEIIKTFTN